MGDQSNTSKPKPNHQHTIPSFMDYDKWTFPQGLSTPQLKPFVFSLGWKMSLYFTFYRWPIFMQGHKQANETINNNFSLDWSRFSFAWLSITNCWTIWFKWSQLIRVSWWFMLLVCASDKGTVQNQDKKEDGHCLLIRKLAYAMG